MKPILQIRFPDTGHTYQLPTQVVLDHQAAKGGEAMPPEAYVLFHMTWDDLQPHARMVEFAEPPRNMGNALTLLVDRETVMQAPATGEAILASSIEGLLSAAACASQMFSSYVVVNDGKPAVHIGITSSIPEAVQLAADSFSYLRDSVAENVNRVTNNPVIN